VDTNVVNFTMQRKKLCTVWSTQVVDISVSFN